MSHGSDLYNLSLLWSRSVFLSPTAAGYGPVAAVCWIIASHVRCLSPFSYLSSLLIEGLKKKNDGRLGKKMRLLDTNDQPLACHRCFCSLGKACLLW